MTTTLRVVGENALMLYLGDSADAVTLARVQAATDAIEQALGAELVDLVPSYASVLILYDPLRSDHSSIARRVRACLATLQAQPLAGGRTVVLPVYYASESGADLEALAARAQLSVEEVIALHTATEYRCTPSGLHPVSPISARSTHALPRRACLAPAPAYRRALSPSRIDKPLSTRRRHRGAGT